MSNLTENIEAVYNRINTAAQRAGRNPNEITLVAVSKTHPVETVIEAYQAGLRHFGENRMAEGSAKVTAMRQWLAENSEPPPVWHFIGHIQSRQVVDAQGKFDMLHSVDSLKLAQRINRLAERDDIPPVDILLECNVSGEDAKFGFALNNWSTDTAQVTKFLDTVKQIDALNKVYISGLMTMAPLAQTPEETRPVFKNLAGLQHFLQTEMSTINWQHLSMGMTNDFEIAIEEGATIIRVGRALFGPRQQIKI